VTDDRVIAQLIAEARYHRQRYDLYRAKAYGLRPTSETRLRERKRTCHGAETRLAAAKQARAARSTSAGSI
jgi:hypothetical protein